MKCHICGIENTEVVCEECCVKAEKEMMASACILCGFPPSACRPIRLTWEDSPRPDGSLKMIVAKSPGGNDRIVCEQCIRDIKRLPFSDFEQIEIPF